MGFIHLLLVSVSTNAVAAIAIDPAHALNITVYHVNPKHLGAKPINMDTGDSSTFMQHMQHIGCGVVVAFIHALFSQLTHARCMRWPCLVALTP